MHLLLSNKTLYGSCLGIKGDVNAIGRVHSYLENMGVINQGVCVSMCVCVVYVCVCSHGHHTVHIWRTQW